MLWYSILKLSKKQPEPFFSTNYHCIVFKWLGSTNPKWFSLLHNSKKLWKWLRRKQETNSISLWPYNSYNHPIWLEVFKTFRGFLSTRWHWSILNFLIELQKCCNVALLHICNGKRCGLIIGSNYLHKITDDKKFCRHFGHICFTYKSAWSASLLRNRFSTIWFLVLL